MSTQAYIYDAIRTPRGKGKKDGALHTVKPISLVVGLMKALEARHPTLDTSKIEDVVLGCVTPVGDQGADIAKTAALAADWDEKVSGMQLRGCGPLPHRYDAPGKRTSMSYAAASDAPASLTPFRSQKACLTISACCSIP